MCFSEGEQTEHFGRYQLRFDVRCRVQSWAIA